MGKQTKWTEEKIRLMQAAGRGKGTLATYQPWIEVADFSSRGNSRRVFSQKTNRVHHLFSDVEWYMFLLLEYSPDVLDIREQYPLAREDTIAISAERSIRHPTYPGTNISQVMTCDFLATRQRGNHHILEVFNCKRTEEAEDARAMEKLEIQRAYFAGCDIVHHLVFHSKLPMIRVRNIEWIRAAQLQPEEFEPYDGYYRDHCDRLVYELAHNSLASPLAEFCDGYDTRNGAIIGTGLRVVRMLLTQRKLIVNLDEPNIAEAPVSMFHLPNPVGLRVVRG